MSEKSFKDTPETQIPRFTPHDNDKLTTEGADVPANRSDTSEHTAVEEERAAAAAALTPPDGGLRAYLVVLGAWCTSFCSFGWINSIGVFQEYYQSTLLSQYPASKISWIPSLQVFFMMAMGPVIGILYDRYGPRQLIFVGTFFHVFGLMMASISTEYYQLLLSQGVCSAIGVSAIFQPALGAISGWFTSKRGAAFGILATGSSLGGVIFPIMLSHLIKQVGFGWSMRISAFLILALLIVANLTITTFTPPKPKPITFAQFYVPFTEVRFAMLSFGLLLFTFGLYIPIDYIPVEAAAAGMSPSLVQYLIPILNAASLFGRAGSGFLGDKIGRYNIFIVVCYATGIFILGLWIPDSGTAGRVAFAALFGFFSGAYVALIPALVIQISPLPEIGFRTGLVFFACAFPGLTTNPISGAILGNPGDWVHPKIFAGVMCLVGTVFITGARLHATGLKLNAIF